MNAVCINIELVSHDVEFNRRMALKKCVLRTPRLDNEFQKTLDGKYKTFVSYQVSW